MKHKMTESWGWQPDVTSDFYMKFTKQTVMSLPSGSTKEHTKITATEMYEKYGHTSKVFYFPKEYLL